MERVFSLIDATQSNTISHVDFQNFMAVFLKGTLRAQLFFTFQVARVPKAASGVRCLFRKIDQNHFNLMLSNRYVAQVIS